MSIGNICRQAYRGEKLNILTFSTHERYMEFVSRTEHQFYSLEPKGFKRWNTTYAPVPKNIQIISDDNVPLDINIDCIFTLARHQYKPALNLAKYHHVPLLCLEVFVPPKGINNSILQESKTLMRGNLNVFINNYSREVWGWSANEADCRVIEHGIDTELFSPSDRKRENRILSVVNDWVNRDWSHGFRLWQYITQGLPVYPLGDTPGLSRAVSIDKLRLAYQNSSIYVNTTLEVPVATAMLEAMASGCAIVSTATCGIPEIIQHYENGLISNDPKELRSYLEMLLEDEVLCRQLGEAARKTVLENYSLNKFIKNWDSAFKDVVSEGKYYQL
jgi:glycosyltransferase involved in cell wall biosynthesis